jgi:hypothetical protein
LKSGSGGLFLSPWQSQRDSLEEPLHNTNFERVRLYGELKKKPLPIVKVFTRDPYSNIPLSRQIPQSLGKSSGKEGDG